MNNNITFAAWARNKKVGPASQLEREDRMRMLCWNVNGIRAAHKKGFLNWMSKESPDILCVQETKATVEQLPEGLREVLGYRSYFVSPKEKGGYSGVALYTKTEPDKVEFGMGVERFDDEGRIIAATYPGFVLYNVYFPNGKASLERLRYKMDFYETFLEIVTKRARNGDEIVVCGDINTAHKEIDLARPRENQKISGFLPEERDWMDRFVAAGFIDTYRVFDKSPDRYTWWDMKTKARERNVGWRIDYFYVSKGMLPHLREAFILESVQGSDHCPIGIEVDL
jgi:exodeoxyribonuclease III